MDASCRTSLKMFHHPKFAYKKNLPRRSAGVATLKKLWDAGIASESKSNQLKIWTHSKFQESAKGAGGKGARVINCHNFFFTPDRETRRIGPTQQQKAQQNEKCDNLRPRPPLRRPPFGPSENWNHCDFSWITHLTSQQFRKPFGCASAGVLRIQILRCCCNSKALHDFAICGSKGDVTSAEEFRLLTTMFSPTRPTPPLTHPTHPPSPCALLAVEGRQVRQGL